MDINDLVKLTSKAWSLTILSLMHEGVPGRQGPLLAASGASRTAFAQSLAHLTEIGMLERNPGHGHPLRPEFRLTARGLLAAALARRITELSRPEDRDLMRRCWTVPVLTTLRGPVRYGDIRRGLPDITDRALSSSLKSLEERDWVERKVDGAARPPRSLYLAVNCGQAISGIAANALAVG